MAAQPAHKLADYMSAMQAKAFPKLTGLELNDRSIPGEHFHLIRHLVILIELQIEAAITDMTQWTESRSLDRLVDFIVKGVHAPSLFPARSQILFSVSSSHPPQEALAEIQVTGCTDFVVYCRGSASGGRCDQSSQGQEAAWG